MEDKPVSYLWYIIPGFIASLPVLLLRPDVISVSAYGLVFVLLVYVVGFIIHIFFRVLEYRFHCEKRGAVTYFKDKIEDLLLNRIIKKEDLCVDILKGKNLDKLYNFTIWSNHVYESHINHIKKINFFIASSYTILISFYFGFVLTIVLFFFDPSFPFILLERRIYVIYLLIFYLIVGLIFIPQLRNLKRDMEANEKFLIRNALKLENLDKTLTGGYNPYEYRQNIK